MPTISTLGQVRELPWEADARRAALQQQMQASAWARQDALRQQDRDLSKQDKNDAAALALKLAEMQVGQRRYEFDKTGEREAAALARQAADDERISRFLAGGDAASPAGAPQMGTVNIGGKDVQVPVMGGAAGGDIESRLLEEALKPRKSRSMVIGGKVYSTGGGGGGLSPAEALALIRQRKADQLAESERARRQPLQEQMDAANLAKLQAETSAAKRGGVRAEREAGVEDSGIDAAIDMADKSGNVAEALALRARKAQMMGQMAPSAELARPTAQDADSAFAGVAEQVEELPDLPSAGANFTQGVKTLLTGGLNILLSNKDAERAAVTKTRDQIASDLTMAFEDAVRKNMDIKMVRDLLARKSDKPKWKEALDLAYGQALANREAMRRKIGARYAIPSAGSPAAPLSIQSVGGF